MTDKKQKPQSHRKPGKADQKKSTGGGKHEKPEPPRPQKPLCPEV